MSSTRLRGRFQEVDVVHRQFGIMHENVIGGCNGLRGSPSNVSRK
jgi:hypothetical protein